MHRFISYKPRYITHCFFHPYHFIFYLLDVNLITPLSSVKIFILQDGQTIYDVNCHSALNPRLQFGQTKNFLLILLFPLFFFFNHRFFRRIAVWTICYTANNYMKSIKLSAPIAFCNIFH